MLLLTLLFRHIPDLHPYDLLQTKFSADRLFLQRLPSQRLARREEPSQVSHSCSLSLSLSPTWIEIALCEQRNIA